MTGMMGGEQKDEKYQGNGRLVDPRSWLSISQVPAEIKEAGTPIIGGTREPLASAIVRTGYHPAGLEFIVLHWIVVPSWHDPKREWQPTHFQLLPDPSEIPE